MYFSQLSKFKKWSTTLYEIKCSEKKLPTANLQPLYPQLIILIWVFLLSAQSCRTAGNATLATDQPWAIIPGDVNRSSQYSWHMAHYYIQNMSEHVAMTPHLWPQRSMDYMYYFRIVLTYMSQLLEHFIQNQKYLYRKIFSCTWH